MKSQISALEQELSLPCLREESVLSWPGINIGVVCGNPIKMSTPSRSRSSAMSSKDYFNWRESMERRQGTLRDRFKSYSMKQGDLGRRTKYGIFKCPHRAFLVADSLEVNTRTPSKMRRLCILEMHSSPIMNKKCNLRKDPPQPATCSRMRASIPLAS